MKVQAIKFTTAKGRAYEFGIGIMDEFNTRPMVLLDKDGNKVDQAKVYGIIYSVGMLSHIVAGETITLKM